MVKPLVPGVKAETMQGAGVGVDVMASAIVESIRNIPLEAVPALVDAILLSNGLHSSSHLLNHLIQAFPHFLKDHLKEDLQYTLDEKELKFFLAFVSMVTHLFKKPGSDVDDLIALIWRVYIPILKRTSITHSILHNQIAEALADIAMEKHSWGEMDVILLPYCLKSVTSCVASEPLDHSSYNLQADLYPSVTGSISDMKSLNLFGDHFGLIDGILPLSVACQLLATLMLAALKVLSSSGVSFLPKDGYGSHGSAVEIFSSHMVSSLLDATLNMLSESTDCNVRHSVMTMLLPSLLKTVDTLAMFEACSPGKLNVNSRVYRVLVMQKVWSSCKSLFSQGSLERQDGYKALSLILEFMLPSVNDGKEHSEYTNTFKMFDVREEKQFWEYLRAGLVDEEKITRKRSLYILKVALENRQQCASNDHFQKIDDQSKKKSSQKKHEKTNEEGLANSGMTKRERWAEMEAKSLGVGVINKDHEKGADRWQRWEVFILLHEMLEEYGTHLIEAAWSHQISLLVATKEGCDTRTQHTLIWDHQSHIEYADVAFLWITVLWQRGFHHGNPQVRRMIMQSFLELDWSKIGNPSALIPEWFVLGPFIQALNDPTHHRDFGLKGIYSSEMGKSAAKFIHQCSSSHSIRDRKKFVQRMACVVKYESLGRAGLMTLVLCIKEASFGSDSIEDEGILEKFMLLSDTTECFSSHDIDALQESTVDLIEVFRLLVESSKQHFNAQYRSQVCEHIMVAALALVEVYEVSFSKLLYFLTSFPRELIVRNGVLHSKIMHWFNRQDTIYSSQTRFCQKEWLARNLFNFADSFVNPQKHNLIVPCNDEEVDAWYVEAKRWARLLCLGLLEVCQFSKILLQVIQSRACEIHQCANSSYFIPVKLLLLILSVVKECQSQQQFSESTQGRRLKNRSKELLDLLGKEKLTRYDMLAITVSNTVLSILGELISYARSSFTIFWHDYSWDGPLPDSVTGKLGGPCQRRLPSLAASSVLQAVLALKAVAECTIWCARVKDLIPDSTTLLLWEFSWNVVTAPIPQGETEAEIRLGAYEALVSVSKALAVTTSCHVLSFVKARLNIEDIPEQRLVDELVCNFLHNVNALLQTGSLARSRQAVLLQHKWRCLDSFLSISWSSVSPNEDILGFVESTVSDSSLETLIYDAIESLESASEDSVLPILRSVRWVMDSGFLKRMTSDADSQNRKKIMWSLGHSAWSAISDFNKRRVAPIAAVLSAIFHPSVFNDFTMHEAGSNKEGPLKWFLARLLEQGVRSPRTMRLTALQLTGMWLLYPATIRFYMKELKLLTLHGGVAIDEDLDAELIENKVAAKEFLTLVKSTDPELTEVFVNSEMYSRITVAVLFHRLAAYVEGAQLSVDKKIQKEAMHVSNAGKMFLLELLDSALNDLDLAKELYKKWSALCKMLFQIHRRKTRAWQMICILSRFVTEDSMEQVTSIVHQCIYRNNLPAVRQYIEIFAVQIYLKFPSMIVEQIVPILCDYSMKPQALSSYVFIAVHLLMHISPTSLQLELLEKLLPPILPFLTSHHHSLRAFSQILVYRVLHRYFIVLQSCTQMELQSLPLEKKCLQSIMAYLEGNADCTRIRLSMDKFLDAFDPIASATPRGLFCFGNGETDSSSELPFECAPISTMMHVIDFLNEVRDELRGVMAEDALILKKEEFWDRSMEKQEYSSTGWQEGKDKLNMTPITPSPSAMDAFFDCFNGSLDFQKKILSHRVDENILNADDKMGTSAKNFIRPTLSDIEVEDQHLLSTIELRIKEMEKMTGERQDLILVASLLGRIPNLAGLARTCEVFKVARLVVADANIVQDKQFQLISVTAEKWIPVQEVPELSLKEYLKGKKREGYSILGLEQTANSIPLNKFSFPQKSVLVLGREKEGIPVDVIHILDTCVEIPQYGVVRSLNVHVSGAIAIWEYTRQHNE
ncbi:uncharacterized protein LOC131067769 isoform X3 [Cryptomeria japonica]|uniref:uncharacterized protein LOC131067769 isoform X3 n=1 Tax=Cryptomeria japonica TaxID=3369 RepID=UPI0025ABD2F3|nr:uncharacterized protein LOC131067769 isoform X3 [Cryptomeria japonica]